MLAYRVIIIENACGQQSTVCVEFQARTQGGGVGGFERTFFIIIIIIIIIVKGRETKQEPTNNTKNYVKTKTKLPRTKLKQKLN